MIWLKHDSHLTIPPEFESLLLLRIRVKLEIKGTSEDLLA